MISDPDVFATLGPDRLHGGRAVLFRRQAAGVAAIDMTLAGLGEYLAERKISPGTRELHARPSGQGDRGVRPVQDLRQRGTASSSCCTSPSLDNDLPAFAFSARPRGSEGLYTFTRDGKEYVASLATMPAEFGKKWQLFIITPLADFTGTFQANNIRLAIFGLMAMALQIVIIFFLTGVVSSPLEKLAFKVGKIQELGTEQLPSVSSPISEISVLSKAIDTLDAAVKSFSAFVPIGLVTQLLQSEQKLELGGHSRFLTIFFSDLEGFSTMSEEVPSQELLLRVSAYLELVTKTVNQEHGTIDKFIGDGVMAFWGAPALLDDHAWRSCVAAMRIQRGMDALNERWQRRGAEAAQRPHGHPQRRRPGGQHRLQGAHELHRDGRRREHRRPPGRHQQGVPYPHPASAIRSSRKRASGCACGRSTMSRSRGGAPRCRSTS